MADIAEPKTIVKSVDHAVLYSDGSILLKMVRFSYPHAFEPYPGGKYGVIALLPKTKEYVPAKNLIRDAQDAILKEKKVKLPADRKFLRDGDQSVKENHEGHWTVSASESRKPAIRGNKRDPKTGKAVRLSEKDKDVIYGGCWGSVLIKPWYQDDKNWGKRINAGMKAIQFLKDDDPFGEGGITEEEVDSAFEDFPDDESGFDDDLGDDDEL